ncbi:hypothetical protein GCM10009534_59630 [Kribbella sandramycini]
MGERRVLEVRQPVSRVQQYGGQQHGHPEHWHDPGRAVAQVRQGQRRERPLEPGLDMRPVEQEAGDREEDRAADVQPREQAAERPGVAVQGDLRGQDGERCEYPQPVQRREPVSCHQLPPK